MKGARQHRSISTRGISWIHTVCLSVNTGGSIQGRASRVANFCQEGALATCESASARELVLYPYRRVAFSVKCAVCRVWVRCGMLFIYLEPFDPHKQLYGRCLCALVHALLNSPSSESRLVSRKGKRSPVASSSGNGAG